ncbi:MAG: DUF1521 domain-containing protein [Phycisphaerae bacterium]
MLGDIGKMIGGALGNAALPGIGGLLGSAIGGGLGDIAGKALKEFEKDPIGALKNPAGFAAQYADGVLGQMGLPAPFRQLAKFAQNPFEAITDLLKGNQKCETPTVGKDGKVNDKGDLKTNGSDVVDTGRYLISAREDGVKIYDKQTKTWVDMSGDPHVTTSDGDKGQFHKNLSIDLPDGTTVKIKTTPQGADGTAYIDKVAVMKGDEAVVMSGFHDGKAGVNMGEVFHNTKEVNNLWKSDTVMRAGHEVDDLFFKTGGEFRGADPSKKFGEVELDGHGGKSRYDTKPGGIFGNLADLLKQHGLGDLVGKIGKQVGGAVGGPKGEAGSTGNTGNTGNTGKSPETSESSAPAKSGGTSSGGGVFEKIFAILQKLQDQLNKKVGELDGLDPKEDKAKLDKGLFDIQSLQQQMTQLTTMATNLSSADHNTKKGIADNLRIS